MEGPDTDRAGLPKDEAPMKSYERSGRRHRTLHGMRRHLP